MKKYFSIHTIFHSYIQKFQILIKYFKNNHVKIHLHIFIKFIFLYIFITNNCFHFVSCHLLHSIKTPGVHNLQIKSNDLIEIIIPDFYQAFIFSNVDMGLCNAFYLDGNVVPVHYQNLYGIAFNGSSCLLLRYYSSTACQNLAIFIIPANNCNQHALFAMSKNIYKLTIETKKFDYNFQTCTFSPSFISDVDRTVIFGYANKIDANAQIFYGFESDSEHPKSVLLSEKNLLTYDKIVNELDEYMKIKREYKNTKINLNNANSDTKVQKDYNEEKFFKKNYQNHKILSKKTINNQTNLLSISNSPGFLVSLKIASETRKLTIVNSTFYIAYHVNEKRVKAKILFKHEFSSKSMQSIDSSMREKHSDFLLFYDKFNSKFIYDNEWIEKVDISYNANLWKTMKWVWIILILIFVIITVLIIGCICGYVRSDRICCFTRKNSMHENTEESDLNTNRQRNASHNQNDNQFETICYSPNLEIDFDYDDYMKKSNESFNKRKNNNESDSYSYEDGKKKKKNVEKNKKNSSLVSSPYELDSIDINDVSADDNKYSAENNELPNPYGLPYPCSNLNNDEDENF